MQDTINTVFLVPFSISSTGAVQFPLLLTIDTKLYGRADMMLLRADALSNKQGQHLNEHSKDKNFERNISFDVIPFLKFYAQS